MRFGMMMENRHMKKIRKVIKFLSKKLNILQEKVNMLYVAISILVVVAIGALIGSCWMPESYNDVKNIVVGLSTGIITSALVTVYIENINARMDKKRKVRYKQMLLNPLYMSIDRLYKRLILNINEYRVREEYVGYYFLPIKETKEISEFFDSLRNIDFEKIEDEKKDKNFKNLMDIPMIYYNEILSQYKGILFESLVLDNIISQEEYEAMKHFDIVNECARLFELVSRGQMERQDEYRTKIQLMHGMTIFINRMMRIFDQIVKSAKIDNERIKNYLDDIWYHEVYVNSEEYVERCMKEMESRAQYYDEHPELIDVYEEDGEEDQLYKKINTAIWSCDVETIKKCFPEIDKNNKGIQSMLTWKLAKDVMKDKQLRRMYYEKYGEKYKVKKEKRWWERG